MSRSCGRSWDYGSYLRSKCTQMLPWWEGHSQFQNMKDQKLNQKKADTEVNIGMERCSLREVKEGGGPRVLPSPARVAACCIYSADCKLTVKCQHDCLVPYGSCDFISFPILSLWYSAHTVLHTPPKQHVSTRLKTSQRSTISQNHIRAQCSPRLYVLSQHAFSSYCDNCCYGFGNVSYSHLLRIQQMTDE